MKISRKNPNPGTWFDIEEGGGSVCLRITNQGALREIRKQCVTKKVVYKKNGRWPVEEVDDVMFNRLLWQHSIVDWKGIYDADTNEEIKCTDDNKVWLCENSVQFLAFLSEKIDDLSAEIFSEEEEKEKN